MIRGPIVPLSREGLWRLVQQRPELLERGLRVVAESLELGGAGAGLVDGLMRDASGAAVLVFATDERDAGLPARVLAALAFWRRNAAAMPRALPEGDLRNIGSCRLVIVGTALPADVLATLERLQLQELEIVEVESFKVGGSERLALRSVRGRLAVASGAPIDEAIGAPALELMRAFVALVGKLDPRIRVDGDRFSRRASIDGQPLGECWFAEDRVHVAVDGESPSVVQGDADLRRLGDRIVRRYLAAIGQPVATVRQVTAARDGDAADARGGFDSLRASMSAARLTPDECMALGEGEDAGDPEPEAMAGG